MIIKAFNGLRYTVIIAVISSFAGSLLLLFVLFVNLIWLHLDNLTWELLILPASIALLALGLRLAEFTEKDHGSK
jgi:membrane-anchored protein YejM (alkaline phosphatase superfamily)